MFHYLFTCKRILLKNNTESYFNYKNTNRINYRDYYKYNYM